ncbi:stonustoxin subunit beta-like [Esox lucius]|uniref:stonustoxin subunit beta-like n=1 Tax=Esox lucius TaxID=8010 RepID=UPI001476A961|nr:stonustoxin subunit beta-like [Esox lucius]
MDPVSVSLLEILNELVEEDVKRFKWHLNQDQFGPEFPPIPKGQLEKADRSDTVDYMVKNYRESGAIVNMRAKLSSTATGSDNKVLKLGELAFRQLKKGHLIFYEEDMKECGIDVTEPSVYPGLYACDLTLDPNTTHRTLSLSEGNRKVTRGEMRSYPDHPDRFEDWWQVLCREGLSGRCYWEVEWTGRGADITVAYKGINRRGGGHDSLFGYDDKSWSLYCSENHYTARHVNMGNSVADPSPSSWSNRVGVYLDWPAGTLSFYSVSSDKLTHLHTFNSEFTKPLYPGFRVGWPGSSVSLCQLK